VIKAGGYMGDPDITGEHEIDIGLRKHPLREPFLKGPLLIRELQTVARMPGKALALWTLTRYRSDLNRGGWVTLPPRTLSEWGIGKDARQDGLQRLCEADLITIERPKGYMLNVKLISRRKRG
jgi:hypothetical protein